MDRWEQIENVYHSARDLRGEARSRFLDQQRDLDNAMRREIETLLEYDDIPDSLLNRPAVAVAADWESTLTGRSLGAYDVLERIGSGGMGQVYRARDRTLKREVAIKVLPTLFMLDPDRVARFRREAQVLAALNHPNIAAIHGFEDSDGVQALVLELVEGPTLGDCIAHGSIPLAEALPIARQIAEALEAAHEQGVVHCDLKPANIKVRADGTVKVLDFGLAKALDPAVTAGREATTSPTVTSPAVMRVGILLGTAAYMSPEQAKGGAADKRSDVWAFGCVLYEMLTGKRVFGGEDVNETLTAVVRDAPDWTAWPDSVPTRIRELVQECLQKNRKDRIADISTARFVMSERRAELTAAVPPRLARQRWWKSTGLVATIAAVAGIVGWSVRPSDRNVADVARFSISLGEDQPLQGRPALAISPDGTQLVYAANRRLYLRSMAELEGRPIAGTESVAVTSPVFSPDGQSVAFWSGGDGALKRVALSGGKAITICQANDPLGMNWSTDGLLFGQSQHGIMRVPATGGTPEVVVSVSPGETAFAPQALPGGRGTMFTLTSGAFFDRPRLVVQTSRPVERKTLIEGATDGRYLPTGHIVYSVAGNLLAVSFDVGRLQVTGTPVPVIEGVARTALTDTGSGSGTAQWSVSRTGSLVYVPGPVSDSSFLSRLALLGRSGGTEALPLQPRAYESPRFSPNGRSIAFAVNDGRNVDLWIYDLTGTTAPRQLTFGSRNRFPTWSPDGQRVAFQSDREGDLAIFAQRADGSGTAERLTKPDADTSHIPESWSPRGDVVSFSVKASRFSLWILSLRDKQARAFAEVESDIPAASAFSFDGRWIAYQIGIRSGADVHPTVFVQPFPASGAKHQVPDSGAGPQWSSDGNELYYSAGPRRWVVAPVTVHPSFAAGNPVDLPNGELQVWRPDWWRQHDVSRDGRRIGLIPSDKSLMPGNTRLIHVVLNWYEELKQRVPVN